MIIPPFISQIIQAKYDRWQVIIHARFDVICYEYFSKTGLHPSFSGYEQSAASTVERGAQDVEAQYLKTLVSIYDGKRWMADLHPRCVGQLRV